MSQLNVTNQTFGIKESIDEVNSDDATWILTSAFIIFTMQSGFGLLESGSVSQKNEANIMVKNAVDVIIGGLAYWIFGFAFSFGDENKSNFFTGIGKFFTESQNNRHLGHIYSRYFFQLSFATTATTIVSGAMAERTYLKAYIAFAFFNTLTYCFPAHWIWSKNGWLNKLGAVDIAGSSAVHVVGGISGLVATIFLKPRTGRFMKGSKKKSFQMASPTNVLLGTFMLWWGWLGFNCGSTFGISGEKWKLAARSAVCTINASVGGGVIGMIYSYIFYKNKFKIPIFVSGLLGGLVGVTAICAVTRPSFALIIGLIGGLTACVSCNILERLHIDDPVSCVPVHFCSGSWSLIAVPFFLEQDKSGNFSSHLFEESYGRWKLLGVQALMIIASTLWSAFMTIIILVTINYIYPIRMSLEDELKGSDLCEHGIMGSGIHNSHHSAFGSKNDHSALTMNTIIPNSIQILEEDDFMTKVINAESDDNSNDLKERCNKSVSQKKAENDINFHGKSNVEHHQVTLNEIIIHLKE
ncbi:putative ammonium transporter 3 [Xenia sp. Carnegie-2017]|uniref:putative ammonium transporter 3 n=1 Tax=Xenia sp. Carnegie-2017 TaxID=2897299 RepID=UPI001F04148C|nr:putative ammonium transporter 3 [Xenia sp. Carnegie-2017]